MQLNRQAYLLEELGNRTDKQVSIEIGSLEDSIIKVIDIYRKRAGREPNLVYIDVGAKIPKWLDEILTENLLLGSGRVFQGIPIQLKKDEEALETPKVSTLDSKIDEILETIRGLDVKDCGCNREVGGNDISSVGTDVGDEQIALEQFAMLLEKATEQPILGQMTVKTFLELLKGEISKC